VSAFDLVYGAGARGQLIAATWKELEPTSGAIDVSPLVGQLDYGGDREPTIFVGIQVINTVAKEVPADLADAIDQWSQIDASRMPFVNLFLLHDFTTEECDAFGDYYGIPNNAQFEAYLCTLGLRLADGTPRPAWQAVVDAAREAGLPSP